MHIWVAALCGLVLCGCSAPKDAYTLTPSNHQQAAVRHGVQALVSSRKHVVFLRPLASHQVSYDRPRFVVVLPNRGKAALGIVAPFLGVDVLPVDTAQPQVCSVQGLISTCLVVDPLMASAGYQGGGENDADHAAAPAPRAARSTAARASRRVESSVGSTELASLMIRGNSVQPSTTASHRCACNRAITRSM